MPLLVVQRGHVPRTRGATGGPYEQEVARAVADLIRTMMPAGWQLRIIDADEPTSRYAGDAFVSLHCDASANPNVRGASVGWRNPQGRALGAAWKTAYASAGWPGTFRADNYTPALAGYYGTSHAVRAGNPRAVIVEQGFTTNPSERAFLRSHAGRVASARAVVWAVTGVDPHRTVEVPTVTVEDVEAFMATLSNREQQAAKSFFQALVNEAGFDPDDKAPAQTLARLTSLLRGPGRVTSEQGLVVGGVNTIDAVRDLGYEVSTKSRTGPRKAG
jgi:hypothetical protein